MKGVGLRGILVYIFPLKIFNLSNFIACNEKEWVETVKQNWLF